MRRKTRDFGRLKLVAAFLFVSVFVPNIINAINSSATDNLGQFEAGETGIKLCATIDDGLEDSLRFSVSNDQGFASDVIVDKDTCRTIKTEAATYTIRQYVPQEYTLESITGGTVSTDNTPFIATSEGQYSVIYNNTYTAKKYLHSFGATTTTIAGEGGQGGGGEDPCESNLLYRHIECLAKTRNYLDTNFDFTDFQNTNPGNNGVNILAETKDYSYPVYYYRGTEVDQHVVWAGKCWDIYRTTSTGGVKMEYRSEAALVNGSYTCGSEAEDLPNSVYYDDEGNSKHDDLAEEGRAYNAEADLEVCAPSSHEYTYEGGPCAPATAGYMYGANYTHDWEYIYPNTTYYFGNDVTYENGTYTLSGDIVSGFPENGSAVSDAVFANHHYFCINGGAMSCSSIGYVVEVNAAQGNPNNYNTISYLVLHDTANIETAKEAMFANEHDSTAKKVIDSWYEEYLASHAADLEDTQFCNDREFMSGVLKGKDYPDTARSNPYVDYATSLYIGARANSQFYDSTFRPTLSCDNTRDSFTVSSDNGNGALDYPIALSTADERLMSGRNDKSTYTMTPLMISFTEYEMTGGTFMETIYNQQWAGGNGGEVAPMVSLKYGATITSGTGSLASPYVIE